MLTPDNKNHRALKLNERRTKTVSSRPENIVRSVSTFFMPKDNFRFNRIWKTGYYMEKDWLANKNFVMLFNKFFSFGIS